ncbi:MAG TPA: pantetheine-phosphate adenylyltransferase, partial [Candidatus Limiplasma sp.]|nr:pantetheine-phosphate adenylyltransferase [Candidatus Limiplasma sp.]
MNKGVCVYPGSFDPVTLGHVDLIERASKLFPELVVAVLNNPDKQGLFPIGKRTEMLAKVVAHLPNVKIDSFGGLLVDYMRKIDAEIVLRGLRAVTDFENEFQMAQVNRQIAPEIETLFLMTSPNYAYISSSAVRQIANFGGDISTLVPICIMDDIYRVFQT